MKIMLENKAIIKLLQLLLLLHIPQLYVHTYLVLTGVGAEVARLVKYKSKLQIDKSNFPLSPIHGESEQEERSII